MKMKTTDKYKPIESAKFRKGWRLSKKQGKDMALLAWAIERLAQDLPLPANWKDHQLKGNLKRYRECHIGGAGDWLLVYEKRDAEMVLHLYGTGSHAELFGR